MPTKFPAFPLKTSLVSGDQFVGPTSDNSGEFRITAGNAINSMMGFGVTLPLGQSMNFNLGGAGDFKVNTNQFVVDTSAISVGISTAVPGNYSVSNFVVDTRDASGGITITTGDNEADSILSLNFVDRVSAGGFGVEGQLGSFIRSERQSSNGVYDVTIGTAGDNASDAVERFRVKYTGNVGIGTGSAVSARLHAISTSEQFRLGYDTNNYWKYTVGASGGLTMAGSGAGGSLTVTPTSGQNIIFSLGGTGLLSLNTSNATFLEINRAGISASMEALVGTSALGISGESAGFRAKNAALSFGWRTSNTGNYEIVFQNGRVGVGMLGPLALVHLDQASSSGAIPVLTLDQADTSRPFINFKSAIANGNPIEAVGAKTLTTTHFLRIQIEGVGYRYLPVGTIA